MTKKQRNQLRETVAHAGAPSDRGKALRSGKAIAEHDIQRLESNKLSRRGNFADRKSQWTGKPSNADDTPHALPHERRLARMYRIAGWFAILLECLFAIWLSWRLDLGWWIGPFIAILLAIVIHGGITIATRRSGKPREGLSTLKKWLVVPSLVLAILSLLLVLSVRTLSGWLLLALLPFLGLALWLASIGLLLLGAALLVAADVYNWSVCDAAEYEALDQEQHESVILKNEFEEELLELENAERQPQPERESVVLEPSQTNSNGREVSTSAGLARVLPALVLATALIWNSGCAPSGKAVQPESSPTTTTISTSTTNNSTVPRALDVHLDVSQSPSQAACLELAGRLRKSLPLIIETWNVRELSVFLFADDGWVAQPKTRLELPVLTLPQAAPNQSGEFSGLRNVEEAQRTEAAKEQAKAESLAREGYKRELDKVLASIGADMFVPPMKESEPSCTDMNGLVARVAGSNPTPRIAIVITDGHETCQESIIPVPAPENIILLFVLVPEKNQPGQRDFELRKAQLTEAFPWAQVVPYFTEDFNSILDEALKNQTKFQSADR